MGQHQSSSIDMINLHFPPNKYSWVPYNNHTQSKYQHIINHHFNNNTIKNQLVITSTTTTPTPTPPIIGQKHTITDYQQITYQLQSLLFRKHNSSCIVEVIDVKIGQCIQSKSINSFLVGIPDCMLLGTQYNKAITIVLQHIPHRLADIGMLTFQQMIYVMGQCFMALHLLYINYGRTFYTDEDLICFNTNGECKVWVNQHLQKNKPNIQANFLPKTVIEQVFQLLESRVCQQTIPQSYYINKAKMEFVMFTHALKFIQRVKKVQRVKMSCIKSLIVKQKKQLDYMQGLQSDSIKALNSSNNKNHFQQIVIRGKSTDHNKRAIKYSLKSLKHHCHHNRLLQKSKTNHNNNNHYNNNINDYYYQNTCTPTTTTTTASKQRHTQQLSIKSIKKRLFVDDDEQQSLWINNKINRMNDNNNEVLFKTTHKSDRFTISSHTHAHNNSNIKPQQLKSHTTQYSENKKKKLYDCNDYNNTSNKKRFGSQQV